MKKSCPTSGNTHLRINSSWYRQSGFTWRILLIGQLFSIEFAAGRLSNNSRAHKKTPGPAQSERWLRLNRPGQQKQCIHRGKTRYVFKVKFYINSGENGIYQISVIRSYKICWWMLKLMRLEWSCSTYSPVTCSTTWYLVTPIRLKNARLLLPKSRWLREKWVSWYAKTVRSPSQSMTSKCQHSVPLQITKLKTSRLIEFVFETLW